MEIVDPAFEFSMNCRRAPTRVICESSSEASSPSRRRRIGAFFDKVHFAEDRSMRDSSSGGLASNDVARSPNASRPGTVAR